MNLFKKMTSSILATVMMLTLLTTGVFAAANTPVVSNVSIITVAKIDDVIFLNKFINSSHFKFTYY